MSKQTEALKLALKLARDGVELHSPNMPEYKVCAALIALAEQPAQQEPVAGLSETQAKAILDLALDLEKTGRLVAITEGQERTDFVARNRNIQCALEDALRNATTPQAQPRAEGTLAREPLTDEQIEIGRRAPWGEVLDPFTAGVRFAETRHDITKGGAA